MNGRTARRLRRQAEAMSVPADARGRVARWGARAYADEHAMRRRHATRTAVAGASRRTYQELKRQHRAITRSGRR